MFSALEIAARNLVQARRRTLLLALAISLVAMLFLVLRAVSNSVGERMVESATTLSAGHINVGGFFKARRKAASPILSDRQGVLEFVKQKVPEAVSVIDRGRSWGRVISPTSSINAGINGIIFDNEKRFFDSLRLASQSEYIKDGKSETKGDFNDLKQENTILLFAGQAKKLEVGVGDTVTLVTEATGGQSNTVDLRVAAIASDIGFMSNFGVFVLRKTVTELNRNGDNVTGVVMIYLKSHLDSQKVMERLYKDFKDAKYEMMDHDPKPFFVKFEKVMAEDWLGQKIDLTVWSDEISFVMWVTTALDFVSFFVVGILGLIIAGGLMNAMWMSVRERTKEIGTLRAMGAHKGFIVRVFMFESILLGFFASAFGAFFASGALMFLNSLKLPITSDGIRLFLMSNTISINVHFAQIIQTLIVFSFITGLASLYPALKAAKLRPVEALMQTK